MTRNFEIVKDVVAKNVAALKNEDKVDDPEFIRQVVDATISCLNNDYNLSEEEINEIKKQFV